MVTLMDEGPSVYLLGWRQGDFTDIHDHGSCEVGVYVAQGTITEELFVCGYNGAGSSRRPCALHWSREVSAGGMINCPQEYLHSIGNLLPEVAATLHCYGPALDDMSIFEMREGMICFKEHWHDAKNPQH
jgi:cysteine dioxygenase